MSQILKMVDGGNAKSKKQQELDQIAANRKKIQDAYDSGALSELAKANLDMISQNAQSYLAADPLHNKNARKFQLELTNRMADIVDGKEGYSPFNTEIADKNIFGYYSSPEMGIIANELVRQTLNGKTGTQQAVGPANTTTAPSGSSASEDMHHTYDWLGGTNLDLLPVAATTKDKVKAVISGLKKGIADVETAHAAGKTIHGFDMSKLEAAKARLAGLSILDTDDDDTAFNKLVKEVLDGTFAIPADVFKSLFSKYYSGSDATTDTVSVAAKAKGYESADDYLNYLSGTKLAQLLGDTGKIYSKDGAYYILDADQKPLLVGHTEINTDNNTGIYVDNTGRIHNIDDVTNTSEITPDILQKIQAEVQNIQARNKLYDEITYDIINQISDDPLLKYVKGKLGRNFTAYDVSNMFFGNDKVLAVSASGKPIEKDYYGRLKYPDDVRFYVLGEDGKLKQFSGRDYATIGELGPYNSEGWNEGSTRLIGNIEDLDLTRIPKKSYLEKRRIKRNYGMISDPSAFSQTTAALLQYETLYGNSIEDPEEFIQNLLSDIAKYDPNKIDSVLNPRSKEWKTNPKKVAEKVMSMIQYYQLYPDTEKAKRIMLIITKPEYQEAMHKILSQFKKVSQSKEGGKIEKPIHRINSDTFSKLSALKQYKKK